MVGRYITDQFDKLVKDGFLISKLNNQLPKPLFDGVYDNFGILDINELLNKGTFKCFENSKFQLNTLHINSEQYFEYEFQGSLLSITYISTENSGSLLVIEKDEEPFVIDTSHIWTRKNKGKFMIKNFVLDWKLPDSAYKLNKVKLITLTNEQRKGWKGKYIKQHNISENIDFMNTSNFISKICYFKG